MPPLIPTIALYYANLIGYLRLALAAVAMIFPAERYLLIGGCYLMSCLLDFIDGPIARRYNQCSLFGLLLDYGTDIIAKIGFVMRLVVLYDGGPQEVPYMQLLAFVFIVEETFGVIFVAYLTGRGKYWKNAVSISGGGKKREPWWIQRIYLSNGNYTWVGILLQLLSNVFLVLLYCAYFVRGAYPGRGGVPWALQAGLVSTAVPAAMNFLENSSVLLDILATWQE